MHHTPLDRRVTGVELAIGRACVREPVVHIPQVPNLLGHHVISSNNDEGILVPSPLHDDYSPEKGQDLKECN